MKRNTEKRLSIKPSALEALTTKEAEVLICAKIMVDRMNPKRRYYKDWERLLVAAVDALGPNYFVLD